MWNEALKFIIIIVTSMYSIPHIPNTSLKECIVRILSSEWPLTTKEIYNRIALQKKAGYGSVYKALNELVSMGIVSKESREYKLNHAWINDLLSFSMKAKVIYESRPEQAKLAF